jgi:hypothetical protein
MPLTCRYSPCRPRDVSGTTPGFGPSWSQVWSHDDPFLTEGHGHCGSGLSVGLGIWRPDHRPCRPCSTLRASTKVGAALTFTTAAVELVVSADRCATCGKVKVYLRSFTQTRHAIWTRTLPKIAALKVSLVVAGTAKRPGVHIGGLLASRTQRPSEGIAEVDITTGVRTTHAAPDTNTGARFISGTGDGWPQAPAPTASCGPSPRPAQPPRTAAPGRSPRRRCGSTRCTRTTSFYTSHETAPIAT